MAHHDHDDSETEYVAIEGTIVRRSEKALLVLVEGTEDWIPLSQVRKLDESNNGEFTCEIPAWLYDKKGF